MVFGASGHFIEQTGEKSMSTLRLVFSLPIVGHNNIRRQNHGIRAYNEIAELG